MKLDGLSPNTSIVKPTYEEKNQVSVGSKPTSNITNTPKDHLESLIAAYGEKSLKKIGVIECTTCANRTYVDGSNDPGVSFKTPGKISPEASASTVMSHELEHVSNEKAKAQSESREIISQSVTLSTSICPECGASYVSGGETRTVTKGKNKYSIPEELLKGTQVDKNL